LADLVRRCLEKRPADRPQTAGDVLQTLDAISVTSLGAPLPRFRSSALRARTLVPLALVAGVVVVAALMGTDRLTLGKGRESDAVTKSIAVLPLANVGADTGTAYFAEGMTEEITNSLTKVPGLRVSGRTTPITGSLDAQEIGATLGVGAVLQGSVNRAGNRLRISVRLVNVDDGFQLWGDRYDAELKDVFAVQDSIARAIAAGLRLSLGVDTDRPLVKAATTDPAAHDLFLRGMYLLNRRTGQTIQQAIAHFRRALERDPGFARAHAGLALAYSLLPDYVSTNVPQAVANARTAARRALSLDSTLAEAYAALGAAEIRLYRNADAERAFLRAIALDSTNATGHQYYAMLLNKLGRFDEAVREMKRARELDPVSPIINTNVGYILYHARRYAEAEAALRSAIDLDPAFANAHRHLGNVLVQRGRIDEGIAAIRRAEVLSGVTGATLKYIACAEIAAGRTARARSILNELIAREARSSTGAASIAVVYSQLGEIDEAVRWLAKAADRYDTTMGIATRDPTFDVLRRDPRGAAIFRRVESME
jgi:serine/threonine-protein kinase